MHLYLDKEQSRAAPSLVESAVSVCLHKAHPLLVVEETRASHPSGRHMTGPFFEAPHHTLHPTQVHANVNVLKIQMQTLPHYNLGKGKVINNTKKILT